MSFELPKGLPKLSDVTNLLATAETQFQNMVKGATKMSLPPGPQSMLLKLQKSFEGGEGTSGFTEAPNINEVLSKLPTLPKLPTPLTPPTLPPLPGLLGREESKFVGSPKGEIAGEIEGGDITLRIKEGIHGEAI